MLTGEEHSEQVLWILDFDPVDELANEHSMTLYLVKACVSRWIKSEQLKRRKSMCSVKHCVGGEMVVIHVVRLASNKI